MMMMTTTMMTTTCVRSVALELEPSTYVDIADDSDDDGRMKMMMTTVG